MLIVSSLCPRKQDDSNSVREQRAPQTHEPETRLDAKELWKQRCSLALPVVLSPLNPTPRINPTHNERSPTSQLTWCIYWPFSQTFTLKAWSWPRPPNHIWAFRTGHICLRCLCCSHTETGKCTLSLQFPLSVKKQTFLGEICSSVWLYLRCPFTSGQSVCVAALAACACFTSRLTGPPQNAGKVMHGRSTAEMTHFFSSDKICCPKMLFKNKQ